MDLIYSTVLYYKRLKELDLFSFVNNCKPKYIDSAIIDFKKNKIILIHQSE